MTVLTRHSRRGRMALAALALLGGMSTALAASWPTKPIQLVVVFPPGGSADQMGRLIAPHVAKTLGQPVVVENRGGAGGMIGTNVVAKGDDHTFGVIFDTHATNVHLMADKLPFDPMQDLKYVTLLGTAPLAIFSNPNSGFDTVEQLFAESRARKPVSYGTVGAGGLGHLAMVNLARSGDFDWQHVPYRGGGPLHMDVAANHVPIGISSLLAIKGLVDGGSLTALAVTSSKRSDTLPEVPTVAESGYEGFAAPTWWGVVASGATTDEQAATMHQAIAAALKEPDVVEKLNAQGVEISAMGTGDFRGFVQDQIDTWGKVIKDNDIKAGD